VTAPSPWAERGWQLSAVALVITVVLGVMLFVATRGSNDSAPSSPAVPAVVSTTAPGGAPSTTGATTSGGSDPLTAAPTSVEWRLWYGIALPSSADGPRNADGSGYAHTPTGALLAVAQIPYRAIFGPDWRTNATTQLLPGPERDTFLSGIEQLPDHLDTSIAGQVAGFRFLSYTPDTAVIDLASGTTGQWSTVIRTLRWVDDDWRVVLNPAGSMGSPPQKISSLANYVPWAGVA